MYIVYSLSSNEEVARFNDEATAIEFAIVASKYEVVQVYKD